MSPHDVRERFAGAGVGAAEPAVEPARWRLSHAAAGRLGATVHHRDLLVRPR